MERGGCHVLWDSWLDFILDGGTEDPTPLKWEDTQALCSQTLKGLVPPTPLAAGGLWHLHLFQSLLVSQLRVGGLDGTVVNPDPAWQDPGVGAWGPGWEGDR